MTWFRKYPLFASGLVLCALVALGEIGLLYERYAASREAAARLQQRKAELAAMEQLAPPPTRAVAAAVEADLAKARSSLAAMQAELKGRGPAADRLRAGIEQDRKLRRRQQRRYPPIFWKNLRCRNLKMKEGQQERKKRG